jgi:hypothetical protein
MVCIYTSSQVPSRQGLHRRLFFQQEESWPAWANAGHEKRGRDVVARSRLLRAEFHDRRPEIEFEVRRLLKTKLQRLAETGLGRGPSYCVQELLH